MVWYNETIDNTIWTLKCDVMMKEVDFLNLHLVMLFCETEAAH